MADPKGYIFDKPTADRIVKATGIVLSGGNYGSVDNSTAPNGLQGILARISASDNDGEYAWTQIIRQTDGSYDDATNGLTGTLDKRFAFDVSGNCCVDIGTVVELTRQVITDGTTNYWGWSMTSNPFGDPTLQGQEVIAVSQNQAGWGFPKLHAIVGT